MSCKVCKKEKCGCPDGSGGITTSQLQAQIAQIGDEVNTITTVIQAFITGHPILMIQNTDDIACFNLTTGLGSTTWLGWGLCNGNTYTNALTAKNITSPNLLDKFIVGALGSYAVGDTGGLNTVSLTAVQNGTHTHTVNDPGHTHIIIDPGHLHAVDDPGHHHSGVSSPITIGDFETGIETAQHRHSINPPTITIGYTSGSSNANTVDLSSFGTTGLEDATHTHHVQIPPFTVTIVTSDSFTGIDIDDAFTGISNTPTTTGITINNSGTGAAHENRPPYFALIFAIKI